MGTFVTGILSVSISIEATKLRKPWVVTEEFVYIHIEDDGTEVAIIAEVGYFTDFASIPRIFRWLVRSDAEAAPAAVIHDWVETNKIGSFAWRDDVFRKALIASGNSKLLARILWCGLRLAFWRHWK